MREGARPPPFTLFPITYVQSCSVHTPAEKADTFTLFQPSWEGRYSHYFSSTPMYSVVISVTFYCVHNWWAQLVSWPTRGGPWAPCKTWRQAAFLSCQKRWASAISGTHLIRLGCRCLVSAVTLLDHNRWATFHHSSLLKMCCICVISTEYTQSGNGFFLASIPSWRKTSPGWVRVGGARPPAFTLFTITYKVAVYAPAERADTLILFHLYQYMYSVVILLWS